MLYHEYKITLPTSSDMREVFITIDDDFFDLLHVESGEEIDLLYKPRRGFFRKSSKLLWEFRETFPLDFSRNF